MFLLQIISTFFIFVFFFNLIFSILLILYLIIRSKVSFFSKYYVSVSLIFFSKKNISSLFVPAGRYPLFIFQCEFPMKIKLHVIVEIDQTVGDIVTVLLQFLPLKTIHFLFGPSTELCGRNIMP